MNIKHSISRARVLFQQGKYRESSTICCKILSQKPRLHDALQIEGLNKQALGDTLAAMLLFKKAIEVKPNMASTYNNLGNAYLSTCEYNEASKCFKKALKLLPSLSEAMNNLANCQVKMGDLTLAKENYKKAISLDIKNSQYSFNFGVLLTDCGDFQEAQNYLSKSLELNKKNTSVYWYVFIINMYLQRYQDALDIANLAIRSESLSDPELCEILVGKAIIFWLFSRYEETALCLKLSETIYQYQNTSKNMANMAIFHQLLQGLLVVYKTNKQLYQLPDGVEEKEIYFISESHCLSPHGSIVKYKNEQLRVRSLFILGAKIFHMVADVDNKYQVALANLLEGLQPHSKVVLAFGEIDCRKDEGIFKYCVKYNKNYKNVIDDMLERYVEILYGIANSLRIEVILYGVPAPHLFHVNQLPIEQQNEFKDLILYFNQKLADYCNKYAITFLDVYQLTNCKGVSSEEHNFDPIHMKPNVVPTLFEQHLVENNN